MFEFDRLTTHRRGFLGKLAAAAALGATSLTPLRLEAQPESSPPPPRSGGDADPAFEAWLNKITGKHKVVFDAPAPNEGMPVIWPRVYLNTINDSYGTTDAQNSAVVILRHSAIPIAMTDAVWAKYKFGELVKVNDGTSPATRNVYQKLEGFPILGVGVDGLLAKGVLVGVCNVALTFFSGMVAKNMSMDAAAVKQEWIAALIPGVQIVPSGVMAAARAQEKGCTYIFAG